MKLNICGIPVEVCRKDVKNMRLYVKPPDGKVTVNAPFLTGNEAIARFVSSKAGWIKSHIANFQDHARNRSKRKYASGDTFYVWGKPYILQTSFAKKKSLILDGEKALLTVRRENTLVQREKFIREWYRKLLKNEITQVLPKWEKKTGLKAESWQVKYMTSRWGSCKIKERKICLSLLLAKKNPECLDYVILHELVHFVEKGHNQRFKNLLGKYMPAWREVKRTLNSGAGR